MKALITIVLALHAVYLLAPPARAAIHDYIAYCPLSLALHGMPPTLSMGDRNGLNPR